MHRKDAHGVSTSAFKWRCWRVLLSSFFHWFHSVQSCRCPGQCAPCPVSQPSRPKSAVGQGVGGVQMAFQAARDVAGYPDDFFRQNPGCPASSSEGRCDSCGFHPRHQLEEDRMHVQEAVLGGHAPLRTKQNNGVSGKHTCPTG